MHSVPQRRVRLAHVVARPLHSAPQRSRVAESSCVACAGHGCQRHPPAPAPAFAEAEKAAKKRSREEEKAAKKRMRENGADAAETRLRALAAGSAESAAKDDEKAAGGGAEKSAATPAVSCLVVDLTGPDDDYDR